MYMVKSVLRSHKCKSKLIVLTSSFLLYIPICAFIFSKCESLGQGGGQTKKYRMTQLINDFNITKLRHHIQDVNSRKEIALKYTSK
jgi:hypothetical protein